MHTKILEPRLIREYLTDERHSTAICISATNELATKYSELLLRLPLLLLMMMKMVLMIVKIMISIL